MNEKLLQYIWNYKKFRKINFKTSDGSAIEMLDFGIINTNAGPDFLQAKIKIDNIVFAGNIELHVKASDWIKHQHSGNPQFNNIILHVVYDEDIVIKEFIDRKIPTLVLKNYIDESLISSYVKIQDSGDFIPCQSLFTKDKIPFDFPDQSLLKKLQQKNIVYSKSLEKNKNNFEALLFQQLAYAFGLKINSDIFFQLANSVDFSMISKIKQKQIQLEALLYGLCGWLEDPKDEMMQIWQREYNFLQAKFSLPSINFIPNFSRLRPPSFPNIRLSQLANLYAENDNLFSHFITHPDLEKIIKILQSVKANDYWQNRYTFGKESKQESNKTLSKSFINLILINCILPLQYFFEYTSSETISDKILSNYEKIAPEENSIIRAWKKLGVKFENALQTQAFLYQYKSLCKEKNCLNCSIGYQLMKDV